MFLTAEQKHIFYKAPWSPLILHESAREAGAEFLMFFFILELQLLKLLLFFLLLHRLDQ